MTRSAFRLGVALSALMAAPYFCTAAPPPRDNLAAGQPRPSRITVQPSAAGMLKDLSDPDKDNRQNAARILGRMGPSAPQAAVPALVADLTDPYSNVRQAVVVALGQIGPKARAAVPALADALKDDNPAVRIQAAIALGRMGPDARAAVSALIDALEGGDRFLQVQAANALGQIGPPARAAIPVLSDDLNARNLDLRVSAADALRRIDPTMKVPDVRPGPRGTVAQAPAPGVGPGPVAPRAPRWTMSLASAVDDFNKVTRGDAEANGEPPLTVNEVVAAILYEGAELRHLEPPFGEIYQDIANTHKLPPDTRFDLRTKWRGPSGRDFDVYWINLTLRHPFNGDTFRVRDRMIAAHPARGLAEPLSSRTGAPVAGTPAVAPRPRPTAATSQRLEEATSRSAPSGQP